MAEINNLKELINSFLELEKGIKDSKELSSEATDQSILKLIDKEISDLEIKVEQLSIKIYLNGPYDKNDMILEIHPGAGGTESCDWAAMLYRMYQRHFEKNGFKTEEISNEPGEEAGLKSVSLIVKGTNAYGLLKSEKGVHRLVRISPFDSKKRRHTSFASVDITPILDEEVFVDIKEDELKIDVYRSSGAGGQSVNTTDSAVRITHLPTKTVVTCQNERSQIKNKEKPMTILKNKVFQLENEKKNSELNKIKGEQKEINFGSQIRSYTLYPYKLVKDHRTGVENNNATAVLDGDLEEFIKGFLRKEK